MHVHLASCGLGAQSGERAVTQRLISSFYLYTYLSKKLTYPKSVNMIENIFTGGAKGIFTGGQVHRMYQESVQNGPQYMWGCVSRLLKLGFHRRLT